MVVEGCLNPLKIDNKNLKSVHFSWEKPSKALHERPKMLYNAKNFSFQGKHPSFPFENSPLAHALCIGYPGMAGVSLCGEKVGEQGGYAKS